MGNTGERDDSVRITNREIYDEVRKLSDAVLTSVAKREEGVKANELAHKGFDDRLIATSKRFDHTDTRLERVELKVARLGWLTPIVSGVIVTVAGGVTIFVISHV